MDMLFTGQRLDETGLYYYNARYYDPTIGRFISADTFAQNFTNPQNLNRYSYVLNNPLRYTDPTGWWTIGLGLNVFLGFIGNVSASKMIVIDFKGGARWVDCTELGVAIGASVSMSGIFQFTTADSVDDLLGTSRQLGANLGPFGSEWPRRKRRWKVR